MMYLLVDAQGKQALLEWDSTNLPYNLLYPCKLIYNLSTGQFRKNALNHGLNLDDDAVKQLPAATLKFKDTDPATAIGFVASNGFSTIVESNVSQSILGKDRLPDPTMSPKRQIHLHTYQQDVIDRLVVKDQIQVSLAQGAGKGSKHD